VHITVHNCRAQQHRTVLIIFPLIIQTFNIAQMTSTGGKGHGRLSLSIAMAQWLHGQNYTIPSVTWLQQFWSLFNDIVANFRRFLRVSPQTSTALCPWTLLGDLRLQTRLWGGIASRSLEDRRPWEGKEVGHKIYKPIQFTNKFNIRHQGPSVYSQWDSFIY